VGRDLQAAARSKPARLLHQEPDLAIRVIREEFNKEYRGVIIDDPALYEEMRRYVEAITPELADRVELYEDPLADLRALPRPRAAPQSPGTQGVAAVGRSIIIERTEALTVIDVNTAKNVGRSNLEETVFANNLEAAEEVGPSAAAARHRRDHRHRLHRHGDQEEPGGGPPEVKEALARTRPAPRSSTSRARPRGDDPQAHLRGVWWRRFRPPVPTAKGRGIILDDTLL